MAIPAVNASYEGTAPTKSGQIAVTGGKGVQDTAYVGYADITLDGTLKTGTVNFIDGTETLPFTPSAVIATANFLTGTGGIAQAISIETITDVLFTYELSAAGTASDTYRIAFIALK